MAARDTQGVGLLLKRPIKIFCDCQSVIHLMKNPVFHDKSKHIDVRLYFIGYVIERGDISIERYPQA